MSIAWHSDLIHFVCKLGSKAMKRRGSRWAPSQWALCGALVCTLAMLLACNDKAHTPGSTTSCAQQGPAFRLIIEAPEGKLPGDTRLRVTYQGTLMESFSLHRPPHHNQDVCCTAVSEVPAHFHATACESDAGVSSAGPAAAIACDVWSNGAAHVELTASGYDTTTQDLQAEVDPDCETIQTGDKILILQRTDGAAP
ncbi:MAG TPA: hypothetical protein VL137_13210 [Polyangiaceae bacterium]|nr:hypothetical protein [Polyangiaceae bacterium]